MKSKTILSSSLKVLITGGSGMVGMNLIECAPEHIKLLAPSSNELNLLSKACIKDYLLKESPDLIIHAAGIVGGIRANINYPVRFLSANTEMANNLFGIAAELEVTYLLNLGSSCMYPVKGENPLKEELILTDYLEPTNEGYAIAKIFAQRLCAYINHEKGNKNYKTLIPCNLYGKYDKFDSEWGHMIPAVIKKIHEAKSEQRDTVEIWGDGEARREFMLAEDLARYIWQLVDNIDSVPELMNVGLGFDYSINDYYQKIAKVVGYEGDFTHDLSKPVGMKRKVVDIFRMKSVLPLTSTSLEEGLKNTFDYYMTKYNMHEKD
ncbi:MAG TPA: GDP-fucose synthetase [Flavobacteriales bacterium]|nr:GDP-fucose synthetase [Flavobacteriales bacterium]